MAGNRKRIRLQLEEAHVSERQRARICPDSSSTRKRSSTSIRRGRNPVIRWSAIERANRRPDRRGSAGCPNNHEVERHLHYPKPHHRGCLRRTNDQPEGQAGTPFWPAVQRKTPQQEVAGGLFHLRKRCFRIPSRGILPHRILV